MKKLVLSAAALSFTPLALANDSDWAALDEDIQALSASVQGLEGTGINIGGRVRAFYNISNDIDVFTPGVGSGVADLGGFSVNNARLYAYGTTTQNIGYRIEVDFADNTGGLGGGANLLDAYLDLPLGGEITARVGQFRAQVLRESNIDSGNLFFADRSIIAALFAGRSQGAAIMGKFDNFGWAVTAQNGADNLGEDLFYSFRAEFDFGAGTDLIEGAFGASEQMEASVGAAYFDDGAVGSSDGVAIEGSLATEQFSAQAVLLVTGDNFNPVANTANVDTNEFYGGGITLAGLPDLSDATPFAIGGTFMLTEATSDYGAWEVGARFQNLDDNLDTTVIDVGVNYYADGHNMKYIFNWTNFDSDPGGLDGNLFRIGVQTRF